MQGLGLLVEQGFLPLAPILFSKTSKQGQPSNQVSEKEPTIESYSHRTELSRRPLRIVPSLTNSALTTGHQCYFFLFLRR